MTLLNRFLGRLFDAVVAPLGALPPVVSLAAVSLVVAVGMLLVFRAASNQPGIAAAKRRLQAGLFELRLFNDDPRTLLRAQSDLLRHNLAYLRLSVLPLVWMVVPLTLLMAQLQSFYGHHAPQPGETFLLTAKLQSNPRAADGSRRPDVQLQVPPGLRAETPDVWTPSLGEIAWRLRAERPGRYAVGVQLGGESLTKDIVVTDRCVRLSPVRQPPDLRAQILYPAEAPLPKSSQVRSLGVTYAPRDIPFLGLDLPWLVVFFLLVTLFAVVLRGRFRVTF